MAILEAVASAAAVLVLDKPTDTLSMAYIAYALMIKKQIKNADRYGPHFYLYLFKF